LLAALEGRGEARGAGERRGLERGEAGLERAPGGGGGARRKAGSEGDEPVPVKVPEMRLSMAGEREERGSETSDEPRSNGDKGRGALSSPLLMS